MSDIDDLRARLTDLGGLAERQRADNEALREQMVLRVDQIGKELDELRPRVATDAAVAARYERLTLERGQLTNSLSRISG